MRHGCRHPRRSEFERQRFFPSLAAQNEHPRARRLARITIKLLSCSRAPLALKIAEPDLQQLAVNRVGLQVDEGTGSLDPNIVRQTNRQARQNPAVNWRVDSTVVIPTLGSRVRVWSATPPFFGVRRSLKRRRVVTPHRRVGRLEQFGKVAGRLSGNACQ